MEPTLRDYIIIIWIHLLPIAFLLSELVDREAGIDPNPPMKYTVNGYESILMHLPNRNQL